MEKGLKFPGDDFIYVFIAAIVLLAVLYFISPLVPTGGEFRPIAEFKIGSLGYAEAMPTKSYELGDFVAGEPQRDVVKQVGRLRVSASLFGSDSRKYMVEVPNWYQESLERLVISFSVDETNMYGNLVVKWNGKVVYRDVAHVRDYTISIDPNYVEELNTLEIYTEPSLRFWASTVYNIRNLKVEVEYGPAKLYSFELYQSELQAFSSGKISFYGSGSGKLFIKVNGKQIYNETPDGEIEIGFDYLDVPLKVGENIVSFDAVGKVNLFNTKISIYLLLNEIKHVKTFNLTSTDLSALQYGKGRIDIDVSKITRQGAIKIKLNNKLLTIDSPHIGSNSVYFGKDDVQVGTNKIELSSTGSLEVSSLSVGVES